VLGFLRRGGRGSDLSPEDTARRLEKLLREGGRFARLARVAATEPPRVRALLGAVGEEIGAPPGQVAKLRASLNPLSRFDFGSFSALPNARPWQAKGTR